MEYEEDDVAKAYAAAEAKIAQVKAKGGTQLIFFGDVFLELKEIPPSISGISGLRWVGLNHSDISDLSPLVDIPTLKHLHLVRTEVTDLAPLAKLQKLKTLWLEETAVKDLSPLRELRDLTVLKIGGTQVSDLSPISNATRLTELDIAATQVEDLRPIAELENLTFGAADEMFLGLEYRFCRATEKNPELKRLSEIEYKVERTEKTLEYLRTLPPYPAPLPWQVPEAAPETASAPDPDAVPIVLARDTGLDLEDSPADAADLADPIKRRLYPQLAQAAEGLHRFGNRYPEIASVAEALKDLTDAPFEEADLLLIHLQIMALTDLRTLDADKPAAEQLEAECLAAVNTVLRVGPPVTLGHPDVDVLEGRLAEYARDRQPPTVGEGERIVTGDLAKAEDLATQRLREVSAQVAKAPDEGRLAGYRRSFHRNTILALSTIAGVMGDAAVGHVGGEVTVRAATFLWAHRDAIMATAPAWGQTGYQWLEYMLLRAQAIVDGARQG